MKHLVLWKKTKTADSYLTAAYSKWHSDKTMKQVLLILTAANHMVIQSWLAANVKVSPTMQWYELTLTIRHKQGWHSIPAWSIIGLASTNEQSVQVPGYRLWALLGSSKTTTVSLNLKSTAISLPLSAPNKMGKGICENPHCNSTPCQEPISWCNGWSQNILHKHPKTPSPWVHLRLSQAHLS